MLQFQRGEYCICIWDAIETDLGEALKSLSKYTEGNMDRMEARFHKAQAGIWRHRAKQLEAESQDLCSRAEALQDHIGWYRARYHELKEENRRLRARLARYAELEKKLNERRG